MNIIHYVIPIEESIIDAFFICEKRERAKYELASPKKRRSFIWKISEKYIRDNCLIKIEESVESFETILNIMKNNGSPQYCYVLSIDDNIDGKILSLSTALSKVVGLGPALISCKHGKLGYLECEQSYGAPQRFILKK